MFKFGFNITDDDLDEQTQVDVDAAVVNVSEDEGVINQPKFSEIPLNKLLESLPTQISYSPLLIPLSSGRRLTLVKRDLFDARFQIISEDSPDGNPASEEPSEPSLRNSDTLSFLDAPEDLVPGIYEGGLKTWECSLDLVDYLDSIEYRVGRARPFRVLEVGCGTAIPTLYVLHTLLQSPPHETFESVHIHVQDFNQSVLQFVTLPNIILTWYMSPASSVYRTTESIPEPDPSSPSDLSITRELLDHFRSSLCEYGVDIRFFAGSWDTFDTSLTGGGAYDSVLTSETIYRTASLGPLIELLRAASCGPPSLEERVEKQMNVSDRDAIRTRNETMCLVAAKVLYFGVGGGVADFIQRVEGESARRGQNAASVESVWEKNSGVGRKILRVRWLDVEN